MCWNGCVCKIDNHPTGIIAGVKRTNNKYICLDDKAFASMVLSDAQPINKFSEDKFHQNT